MLIFIVVVPVRRYMQLPVFCGAIRSVGAGVLIHDTNIVLTSKYCKYSGCGGGACTPLYMVLR